MLTEVAGAAGTVNGMVGGQVADLLLGLVAVLLRRLLLDLREVPEFRLDLLMQGGTGLAFVARTVAGLRCSPPREAVA